MNREIENYLEKNYGFRRWFILGLFGLAACGLSFRLIQLQLIEKEFLQQQGNNRYLRTVGVPAHRGAITDRNGEPLAISTPISTIACDPTKLTTDPEKRTALARAVGISVEKLESKIRNSKSPEFVYLKRQVEPEFAARVMTLKIPGVFENKEYRRFYPAADVTAHVVGFTNIDDKGQEGVELAFNQRLSGKSGSKRVIKDLTGHIIDNVESIKAAEPGKDLALSIDKRIQYLAYRELTAAVLGHKARSGSIVVLDTKTGEILAMVNQPSYNPNNRKKLRGDYYRNRAVSDVFEPGSTIKPFTVAAALEAGIVEPDTPIDTRPGYFMVSGHTVQDTHNYGLIDVATVVEKSSNVGVTKMALEMQAETLWGMFKQVGFGTTPGVGFPGERGGALREYSSWRKIEQATMSFGYGMSVTALQLAQAYGVFASDGLFTYPGIVRTDGEPETIRVMSKDTSRKVLQMMESVVKTGTGKHAQIPGYRVAGKTGTVHKVEVGGYAKDRYLSLFAGIAPVSNPRLVAVIMISEPTKGEYYGGQVAAPVFSRLIGESMRLMNISPDDIEAVEAMNKKKLLAGRQH